MKTQNTKQAILERFKDAFNLSNNADLSRFLGISPATISNWYARNSLDYDLIFSKCKDIDLNWLLTGQKPELKNGGIGNAQNDSSISSDAQKMGGVFGDEMGGTGKKTPQNDVLPGISITTDTPTIYSNKHSRTAVPFYDLPVSAGALGMIDVGNEQIQEGYVDMPIFADCDQVLPVVGISMEPVIYSGDFIGIKSVPNISTRWDFLQTGKIYLIVTREERMIKYLQQATDSEYIVCSSPNYSPFKVHKGSVLQVFRVAAIARGV